MKFQTVNGFKDILPDEAALWQRLEQTARSVFRCFGLREIRVPIVENTELFARAIGEWILQHQHPYRQYSLLASCVEKDIPVTAHVALGTDIIHQHPEMDGAVTGEMTTRDFRLIASVVADLGDGGRAPV